MLFVHSLPCTPGWHIIHPSLDRCGTQSKWGPHTHPMADGWYVDPEYEIDYVKISFLIKLRYLINYFIIVLLSIRMIVQKQHSVQNVVAGLQLIYVNNTIIISYTFIHSIQFAPYFLPPLAKAQIWKIAQNKSRFTPFAIS